MALMSVPKNGRIECGFVEYGRETLKAGMTLAEWEERMIEHLGAGVRPHLRRAWDTLHQDATTPPRAKRGLATVIALVLGHSQALLRSGKQAALWVLAVAVVFALGVVWTGGLYTVTIGGMFGPVQIVYRTNRITGTVEATGCRLGVEGGEAFGDCGPFLGTRP